MRKPWLIRLATFLATVVAAWGVLAWGTEDTTSDLDVGDLAPQTYEAQRSATVEDVAETNGLRDAAREGVEPIRNIVSEIQVLVESQIDTVFSDVEQMVYATTPPVEPPPTTSSTTTTTAAPSDDSSTTTTAVPAPSQLTGVVYIDADGDGAFDPDLESELADVGLSGVEVEVSTHGEITTGVTDEEGAWSVETAAGSSIVTVNASGAAVPDGFIVGTENSSQTVECAAGDECTVDQVGFVPNLKSVEVIVSEFIDRYSISEPTAETLATAARDDVLVEALGGASHLEAIRIAAQDWVSDEFRFRITEEDIADARARVRQDPPRVVYEAERDDLGSEAAGEVVETYLQANYLVDQEATEAAREAAAAGVEPITVDFAQGQVIVTQGEMIDALQLAALDQTGALVSQVQAQGGLLAVVAVLVALLALYLSRFRPDFWARPRMVALLGILVVLAAASVRATVVISEDTSLYVLPAVAFGFMAAVLFDSRIAVLMALAVGVLTAAGSSDVGLTVYASLATLAPIPFVSSVSSRGAFRTAVVYSSLTAAAAAGATAWLFHLGPTDSSFEVIGLAIAWAFGVSVIASLVGLAALQFFESAFDITTSLSLLDLTDRNHDALQLLQEKAFGTFNHSLMVGTLADAASRAIGANALLARAMAYYHDLGKTEAPTFFIENQFGIPNPHDDLAPEESAEIIRRHVSDGVKLARRFKIPSEIAAAIVSHHGDGVMRYFYEKARTRADGDVDPDDYRHTGHKPRTVETAIVMLADSLEAACRAVFQTEEPNPVAIEKVVNRIVDEKLSDGQLSESPLTLADITNIRQAFLESLVGHYHQRIAYPNFPGV